MPTDTLTSLLGNLWSIFMIVLFFGGSIFVHELGHYLAARRRGLKVERFSIGFGPALWRKVGKDGCEYRLSVLPFGGYVALPQLADLSAIEGETKTDITTLPPVSYGTKVLVFVAGAAFNILFAFVLATILWISGRPESEYVTSTRIGYVVDKLPLADGTEVESPAAKAGLREGDRIISIDGRPVRSWPDILTGIVFGTDVDEKGERLSHFVIERNGIELPMVINPIKAGDEGFRKVGIDSAYAVMVNSTLPESPAEKLKLQPGDKFMSVGGQTVFSIGQFLRELGGAAGQKRTVEILRSGKTFPMEFDCIAKGSPHPLQGLEFRTNWRLLHQSPLDQIGEVLKNSVRTLKTMLHRHGDVGLSNMQGPIGMAQNFWDALNSDYPIRFVLWITVMINVSLAFLNLLPIPVLDGGQIVFATAAKLRGRPLPINFLMATQSIFIVLLLSMMLYVTVFGDLRRIVKAHKDDAQSKEAAAEQKKAIEQPAPAKP